jgi:hypothetical protein
VQAIGPDDEVEGCAGRGFGRGPRAGGVGRDRQGSVDPCRGGFGIGVQRSWGQSFEQDSVEIGTIDDAQGTDRIIGDPGYPTPIGTTLTGQPNLRRWNR